MKELNYGAEYKYAHAYPGNFVLQEFLPDQLSGMTLYDPGKNPQEEKLRQGLRDKWKEKYRY
ncbi:hypothetical protein D3C87_1857870 [compost metagenome]